MNKNFSQSDRRSQLVKKNIVASFEIKVWTALVQLMLVPLTLSCLGVYENGVWLTIGSVLLWINNLDIGLGNGLRNKLAMYLAKNDIGKAREMVSSTLVMLVTIITPTLFVLLILQHFVDNYSFFNVNPTLVSNLNVTVTVATILFCGTFIFKFIGNFYMALQLPAVNNLLVAAGSTLALIGTYIVYITGCHSMLPVAIVNTAGPLIVYVVCYPLTFCWKHKELRPSLRFVKWSSVRELFSIGTEFFILQVSGVILFLTSNIVISNLFSPEMVTPYQIAYRYFSVIVTLFSTICTPYWTATTDAYVRKDFAWLKRSSRTLNRFVAFMAIIVTVMILASDFVYGIWIQNKAAIPYSMTVIIGIYQFVLMCSTRYSYIINGIGTLKVQLIFTATAAILYLPSAIIVGKLTGNINYMLIVMCAINIPGLIANYIQNYKIINEKATGIWLK